MLEVISSTWNDIRDLQRAQQQRDLLLGRRRFDGRGLQVGVVRLAVVRARVHQLPRGHALKLLGVWKKKNVVVVVMISHWQTSQARRIFGCCTLLGVLSFVRFCQQ